jgi:hypothetical protein
MNLRSSTAQESFSSLNSDQLADRLLWDKLREKVIDQELMLNTTPTEAFDIAVGLSPSPYASRIKETIVTCGITNIRIICKVIKAVNRMLSNRADLSKDVLGRVIPSTVLLSAIHYKGIEDGPSFEFVLNVGNPDDWGDWGKKEEELDEAGKIRARWRLQLHELEINSCDEYEKLVVDFLNSGMFDVADVAKIIERYSSEAELMRVQGLTRQLHDHVIFHHKMTETELVAEAKVLAEKVHLLDAYTVTSLHDLVSGLANGGSVADSMIDKWIENFKSSNFQDLDFDDVFQRPVHPQIKAAFDATKTAVQAKTTVFDALTHIAINSGWGRKQEGVMKSVSVQDIEETIKSLAPDDLRHFMSRFLKLCVQRETYRPHFGSAMDHFIEACRNICTAPNTGRLSGLIKLLFKDANLESELNPLPTTAASPATAVATDVAPT